MRWLWLTFGSGHPINLDNSAEVTAGAGLHLFDFFFFFFFDSRLFYQSDSFLPLSGRRHDTV